MLRLGSGAFFIALFEQKKETFKGLLFLRELIYDTSLIIFIRRELSFFYRELMSDLQGTNL